MAKIKLDEVLKEQNKTKYWLQKHTGLSHITVTSLVNKEALGIHFETLDKICTALDCSVEDILEAEEPKNK